MNKGLEIRARKKARNNAKMRQTRPDQEGCCRFVAIEYMVFKRINGKQRADHKEAALGLQIGNKVFLSDGHYKFINNKNLRIKKKYQGIPDGASEGLIEKYNELHG